MDELEILQSIDEARAAPADDSHPPWEAPDESARFIRALPRTDWRMLRRVFQAFQETFLRWRQCGASLREVNSHCGTSLRDVSPESPTNAPHSSNSALPTPSSLPHAPSSTPLLPWSQEHLPEYFTKPPSAMHQWMAERLDAMSSDRGSKLNVLGPRGGAKSTLATLAYPLRAALEGREPYIWIISDTKPQAHAHLESLKAELLDNPHLVRSYPHLVGRGPVWRAGAILLPNGVTIEAFGTGQRLRGRRSRHHRPTLIICDDLQNDRHMESALQRDHARTWFHSTLLKAGSPDTNFVNLATALHREALAMELVETPGWTSRIFRSIDPWPFNMSLWEQWEAIYADPANPVARDKARQFYQRHKQAMDSGASVLWPEVEDLYTLMCLRAESGRSAFEREKQNSPVNPDLCEWPESYFDEKIWFDEWPVHPRIKVLMLDPSKGGDAHHGDYSAFVRLVIDRQGILYVQADLARRPTPQIIADGVEHYRQLRPHAFGVEANQFQD